MRTLFFIVYAIVCLSVEAQDYFITSSKYGHNEFREITLGCEGYEYRPFFKCSRDYFWEDNKLVYKFFNKSGDLTPAVTVEYNAVSMDSTKFWDKILVISLYNDSTKDPWVIPKDINSKAHFPFIRAYNSVNNSYVWLSLVGTSIDIARESLQSLLFNMFTTGESDYWGVLTSESFEDFQMEMTESGLALKLFFEDTQEWHKTINLTNDWCRDSRHAVITTDKFNAIPYTEENRNKCIENNEFFLIIYEPFSKTYSIALYKDNRDNADFARACCEAIVTIQKKVQITQ